MSLQQFENPPPAVVPTKLAYSHPLSPITADEITHASALIRSLWPENTSIQFKVITLDEPSKAEVIPYLDAEHGRESLPAIERKAFVNYYLRNTVCIS
jgi:primary-amine oxidase